MSAAHHDVSPTSADDSKVVSVTPLETALETEDRRSSPRQRQSLRLAVQEVLTGIRYPAWLVDRSLGGMCLALDHRVEAGTLLAVRRASASDTIPWVDLRVRHVREYDSSWEIGCEFVRTPPWEVLAEFE